MKTQKQQYRKIGQTEKVKITSMFEQINNHSKNELIIQKSAKRKSRNQSLDI